MRGPGIRFSLFFALVLGCGVPRPPDTVRDEPDERVDRVLRSLRPASAGSDTVLQEFGLEERMRHYRVPGVGIAVIHDGRIGWARGYGEVLSGSGSRVTPLTLFQAASISKPLTAMAVLRLVDDGVVDVDVDINNYLTSWRVAENVHTELSKVTLRFLLGHMAGLNVPGFPGYSSAEKVPSLVQVLQGCAPANTEPVHVNKEPGTEWAYSGGGYCVVQLMMTETAGESFPVLMKRLALEPLGMEQSTFEQPLPESRAIDAAVGHGPTGKPVTGRWNTYPEMAAAGLWTTPSDLARFALGIQAAARQEPGALLSPASTSLFVRPQFGSFSLGLLVRKRGQVSWITHNGGNHGYRCLMYAYLDCGEGAVVMTNSDNGMNLAGEIVASIAREYSWPRFVPEDRF